MINVTLSLQNNYRFIEILNITNYSVSQILFYLDLFHSPRDTSSTHYSHCKDRTKFLMFYNNLLRYEADRQKKV